MCHSSLRFCADGKHIPDKEVRALVRQTQHIAANQAEQSEAGAGENGIPTSNIAESSVAAPKPDTIHLASNPKSEERKPKLEEARTEEGRGDYSSSSSWGAVGPEREEVEEGVGGFGLAQEGTGGGGEACGAGEELAEERRIEGVGEGAEHLGGLAKPLDYGVIYLVLACKANSYLKSQDKRDPNYPSRPSYGLKKEEIH
ncbi:hypothetical protein GQ43DRAFT_494502 [Delitschia confertaspora ATCC 74209]|uniref:Uncharacterized protein n=1 Tax=Delitschia confertaspora ATCC 74209 TaxID=1513339 RepID=A0A9P4MM87_9PLEO|nr:hypothetical protein GQ43DRAFT_494502 [Delitschia confertaspora ATCC 74209]